jgi:hypothetical protein
MKASAVLEEVFVNCDHCGKNFKTAQGFKTIVIKHIRIYQKVINTRVTIVLTKTSMKRG